MATWGPGRPCFKCADALRFARLRLHDPLRQGRDYRWGAHLEVGGRSGPAVSFTGEALSGTPHPEPFLLALLLPAMRRGWRLHIDEGVDAGLLVRLDAFQRTWARWLPRRFRRIRIEAAPHTTARGPAGAVTCFSGGVDSSYTLLRHGPRTRATPRVEAGLFVHGFDIPREDTRTFAGACARAERMLASQGADLLTLRTNLRGIEDAYDLRWDRELHGAALAAALWCLADRFGTGIIPSTYPDARPKVPWGSNPVTDPCLGGEKLKVVHDGAEAHKLDKVRWIAADPTLARDQRVCWEGEHLDRNCGHCWKCVTTQVCFWIAGVDAPAAFPDPASLEDVRGARQKNEQNAWLYTKLRNAADEADLTTLREAIDASLTRAGRRGGGGPRR